MDAIARHYGVHYSTVSRAVKNMNAGKVSDVAMQDLVPSLQGHEDVKCKACPCFQCSVPNGRVDPI